MQGSPLALVQRSPQLVAEHDRAVWLSLFAEGARLEDPSGTLQQEAQGDLGRFWDAFIAPNTIGFEAIRDFVDGRSVLRDVDIHTTMAGGATVVVRAAILYELDEDGLITRLQATWSMVGNTVQILRLGPRGWWAITAMSWHILRGLGLGGCLRYGLGVVGTLGRWPGAAVPRGLGLRVTRAGPVAIVRPRADPPEWVLWLELEWGRGRVRATRTFGTPPAGIASLRRSET